MGNATIEFSPLLHLPQLTALSIDGNAREAAAVIAQLTGLRRLHLDVEDLQASQAAGLAALTSLTELRCSFWTEPATPASAARKGRSKTRTVAEQKDIHLFSTVLSSVSSSWQHSCRQPRHAQRQQRQQQLQQQTSRLQQRTAQLQQKQQ